MIRTLGHVQQQWLAECASQLNVQIFPQGGSGGIPPRKIFKKSALRYLKVTKFSDTLNLAILYLMKLAHTKFSNFINCQLMQSISHAFNRFSLY